MNRILHHRFVLAVPDLKRSATYYRDVLGFSVHEVGDDGWRFVKRDGCVMMLGECPDAIPPQDLGDHSYFAYIDVDQIDELYQDFKSKGAELLTEVADKPWGMREFALRTIDGHRIMFGQELANLK